MNRLGDGLGRLRPLMSSARMDWGTPPEVIADLLGEGIQIGLDVCATKENAKAAVFFSPRDDGLAADWSVVGDLWAWMNPPYGREIGLWMATARAWAERGVRTVALVPARTETAWFRDNVLEHVDGGRWAPRFPIDFFLGRLRFEGAASGATFPSCLVYFDVGAWPLVRWRPAPRSVCGQTGLRAS